MSFLKELNNEQKKAVTTTEGYLRVIAGAGTGKTKVLVSRYAYLVQERDVNALNILCVTFTNKAAKEMRQRIRKLIGEGHETTLVCTYHSFCARLIRENAARLNLTKHYQILDTTAQRKILTELLKNNEAKIKKSSLRQLMDDIQQYKREHNYVPLMIQPEPAQFLQNLEEGNNAIIEEYLQYQRSIHALDFTDLIDFALYLLSNNDDVRERWQERLKYVMVDEFQDTSKKEMYLIELLIAKHKNLMVVGDGDQSIYGWRDADVNILIDFDGTHRNTRDIFLKKNYRSTPEILECANTLIRNNKNRLERDLVATLPHDQAVKHYHSANDAIELERIIQLIRNALKDNYKYSDIAILYRSAFLSNTIEKKLVENGIPYSIYGSVRFYEREEVQDIIAYLRVIAFEDDIALKRIINKPRRQFGLKKLQRLIDLQEAANRAGNRQSLLETLAGNLDDDILRKGKMDAFVDFIKKMQKNKDSCSICEIVSEVCTQSGLELFLRRQGDEDRVDNMLEFVRMAAEFEDRMGETYSLEEFLQEIALQCADKENENKDSVNLLTIHAAKGLEFPVVLVVGLSEGLFPSYRTIEERKEEGLEEERRLCYVAITRAKKRLYLLDSEGIAIGGIYKCTSRFIEEIKIE